MVFLGWSRGEPPRLILRTPPLNIDGSLRPCYAKRMKTGLLVAGVLTCLGASQVEAGKEKAAPPQKASAQTARGIDELQGKFRWGMSVDEVKKVLTGEIRKRYAEDMKRAASDPIEQDKLSTSMSDDLKRIEASYIEFIGQKTPWEVSIIDAEFAHGNQEAMLVIAEGEKKQRRFLFFHEGKLYKQFIAFDKELFAGKSFNQFAQVIQGRYGRGTAKYALNRKGEQVLDHLAWPPSGASMLRAVDQSNFYDTFCLVVEDHRVAPQFADKHRAHSSLGQGVTSPLVHEVAKPESVQGDVNADIVDRITGRNRNKASKNLPATIRQEPSRLDPTVVPERPLDRQPSIREEVPLEAPSGSSNKGASKPKKKGALDDLEL